MDSLERKLLKITMELKNDLKMDVDAYGKSHKLISKIDKFSEDALTIAREYAEECCKKQREICAEEYQERSYEDEFNTELMDSIKLSPLATEVQ